MGEPVVVFSLQQFEFHFVPCNFPRSALMCREILPPQIPKHLYTNLVPKFPRWELLGPTVLGAQEATSQTLSRRTLDHELDIALRQSDRCMRAPPKFGRWGKTDSPLTILG